MAFIAEDCKKKLTAMGKKEVTDVTIDLAGVDIVESVGLGLVIATHNSLSHKGGKLTVINASDDVFQLFKTMRLDQHFEVQPV